MQKKVISLFFGAMGLDIGLAEAGLDIVIGQDFDNNCVATMRANHHNVLGGDITKIQASEMLELAGMKKGEPFMICGGPPCQPFSTAGKRLGINDPRGSLFMDYVRMIDGIRPRFFVFENVKGLLSSKLRDEEGKETDSLVIDVILREFEKLRYRMVYDKAKNRLLKPFMQEFCRDDGEIDWDKLVAYNSGYEIHLEEYYKLSRGEGLKTFSPVAVTDCCAGHHFLSVLSFFQLPELFS